MKSVAQSTRLISREEWAKIVAEYGQPTEPEHRRRHPRHPLVGAAKLTFTVEVDGQPATKVHHCAVLQISAEGLTLRSHNPLAVHAVAAIELPLEVRNVGLEGRVVHCTQTVGAYKVGIELRFREPGAGKPREPR